MTCFSAFPVSTKGRSVSNQRNLPSAILKSPIVWGSLAAAGFYGVVLSGTLTSLLPATLSEMVTRYFTHHPVEYMETVLFGIGLAALVLKWIEIRGQWPTVGQSLLGPAAPGYEPVNQVCQELLQRLHRLPAPRAGGYLPRRLQAAVEHVSRKGSAQDLDDELKYLADVDATRQHNSYALFRVIIWAIPILGFLGTVIGITMALNGVRTDAIEESMNQVVTGLGVKFDTTALALAMAMVLMFLHFFVDRWENSLLEEVDRRMEIELDGRFPQASPAGEGSGAALRQMTDAVVLAIERMVQRQTEVWQASMDAAAARWARMAQTAGSQVQESVAQGLAEGLRQHAEQLAAAEEAATLENRDRWEKIHQGLTQNVAALASLEGGVSLQAEMLGRAVEASGDVIRLEDALNHNLSALAGSKHLEQSVLGLAAAIHLLNARLTDSPGDASAIQLDTTRPNAPGAGANKAA
jgi:flagellar biosynthesis/type III secretory pathway protein FliH